MARAIRPASPPHPISSTGRAKRSWVRAIRRRRYTKYNLALSSILRDKNLHGKGEAIKVDGRYLGAWNAYPSAGYEEGAAVIGLAWSHDLLHWELTEPILLPQDGAPWEHGGLYRPDLLLDNGTYYLYYNAKTDTLPKSEGGGWHEQSGVATSRDLKTWTRYAGNPILPNGSRDANARDSRFASNPYVVKNGREFAMFYFGFGYQRPGRACEMLALGTDPFHFTKASEILIDTGRTRQHRRDLCAQAIGHLSRWRALSLLLRGRRQVSQRNSWHCGRSFETLVAINTASPFQQSATFLFVAGVSPQPRCTSLRPASSHPRSRPHFFSRRHSTVTIPSTDRYEVFTQSTPSTTCG